MIKNLYKILEVQWNVNFLQEMLNLKVHQFKDKILKDHKNLNKVKNKSKFKNKILKSLLHPKKVIKNKN